MSGRGGAPNVQLHWLIHLVSFFGSKPISSQMAKDYLIGHSYTVLSPSSIAQALFRPYYYKQGGGLYCVRPEVQAAIERLLTYRATPSERKREGWRVRDARMRVNRKMRDGYPILATRLEAGGTQASGS